MIELKTYNKKMQGNGYGDLLFKTAIEFVRNNNFNLLCADTRYDRSGSQHLMRKYGLTEIPRYNNNAYAQMFFGLKL